MLQTIILKSLELGFDHYRDIKTIVEKCNEYQNFDNLITKQNENNYNFMYNHDKIVSVLYQCIKNNLIIKPNRGIYHIKDDGLQWLYQSTYNIEIYIEMIKNTEKEHEIMREHFRKVVEEANTHPIRKKYYINGKLIPEILNELKGCNILHNIDNDKLYLYVFRFTKKLAPASYLYQDDIVLSLNEDDIVFRDL